MANTGDERTGDTQSLTTILENATKAINEAARTNGGADPEVPEHGRAAAGAITQYGASAANYVRKAAGDIENETELDLADIRAELAKFTGACEEIAAEFERASNRIADRLIARIVRIKRAAIGVQETSREYLAPDDEVGSDP